MAYKKTYRRKPYKKTYRKKYRKRSYNRGTVSTVNKVNPFPNKFVTKLRYQEAIKLNPGIATTAGYVFRASSCFDPNLTGVGHQPRYFDEIHALYDHHVVLGAKITATFVNNQNTAMCVGVSRGDDNLFSNTINDLIEQRHSKWTYLNEQNGGDSIKNVSITLSPKKFLGRASPLSDPDLKGSAAANPAEGGYFNVWAGSVDLNEDGGQIECHVLIDYTVAFIEPKEVVAS